MNNVPDNFTKEIIKRMSSKRKNNVVKSSIDNPPKPKYAVGQPILIMFGSKCSSGIIINIKHIFNWREAKYSWGYEIDFRSENIGPNCTYIPEEYLQHK